MINPVTWVNAVVNHKTYATQTAIPWSNVPSEIVFTPAQPITLTGATPTLNVFSGGDTAPETDTEVLSANTTLTTFASTVAPVNGKSFHFIFCQPSGGHNYTLAASAGAGTNLVYPDERRVPLITLNADWHGALPRIGRTLEQSASNARTGRE